MFHAQIRRVRAAADTVIRTSMHPMRTFLGGVIPAHPVRQETLALRL
jgi:hypothetical protein